MKRSDSAVEQYWANFFGVDPSLLDASGVCVLPHAALAGYHGAWIFRRPRGVVISVPQDLVVPVEEASRGADAVDADWFNPSFLRKTFPIEVERTIGPAYQGYVDPRRFRGRDDPTVRLAAPEDRVRLDRLQEACAAVEWEHGAIAPDDERLFVRVRDGDIVAAARAKKVDGIYPSMGLITHPLHRGKGHAVAVAAAATADALSRDQLVLWQTLTNNAGSIKIAERLGYAPFAESMAVRFK